MMQPLSLQNRSLYAPGLTGNNVALAATPQADAPKPYLGTNAAGGNSGLTGMMPMIMQLLQGIMQLFQTMFPQLGGGAKGAAGGQADVPGAGGQGAGNPAGGNVVSNPALNPASNPYGGSLPGSGSQVLPGGQGGQADGENTPNAGGGPVPIPTNANIEANKGVNYSLLPEDQRAQFTHLNDNLSAKDERTAAAIIHIGGRAHISEAVTASGVSPSARIYNNVLQNPNNFKPEEVNLIQGFAAKERAETAGLTPDGQGFVTGKYLDYAFIDQMGNRNGSSPQKMQEYKAAVDARIAKVTSGQNLQQVIADSNTTVNIVSDVNTLQQRTGLNRTEQAAYRLAGHSVLFSQDGTVSSDILGLTYQNANSLDSQGNAANGGQDVNIDREIEALASADQADDGQVNGSSLRRSQEAVMDKIFLGTGGLQDNNVVLNQGQQVGLQNGRSMSDIQRSFTGGGLQALNDLKSLAKDHSPAMLAAGGTMAAASAVCPFLGGMAAGAAGIGAANNNLAKGA